MPNPFDVSFSIRYAQFNSYREINHVGIFLLQLFITMWIKNSVEFLCLLYICNTCMTDTVIKKQLESACSLRQHKTFPNFFNILYRK